MNHPSPTIHPIRLVDRVIDEYKSYLRTEFRAHDPALRQALEAELDEPRFLAQEPFFQAHRPFRNGKRWSELGLDQALARVMVERAKKHGSTTPEYTFLHQSQAIEELLKPAARPVVVTTGTGSGKTECFLLPVIQNAIEDSVRFHRSGLTALLVYPMNALANDQEERIQAYLEASGHTHVQVARYDRSTKEEERARLRKDPPHLLLTNYMMLEYLLVRPADRKALFVNHRCRYVVLDEVHTYRGSLGANIALLFRRLRAHLDEAEQSYAREQLDDWRRRPGLVPIATSATIKSVDEAGRAPEQIRQLRDEAVQDFLGRLTGFEAERFLVVGEELAEVAIPTEATWPARPVVLPPPDPTAPDAVRRTIARLAGLPEVVPLAQAAAQARVLWTLGDLLARRPMSLSDLTRAVLERVPERQDAKPDQVRQEVAAALVAGAALPDGIPGALRLRVHRFLRGGWRFHRCINPECGKLYPMGTERCTVEGCGHLTAPLFLCRSCGADALQFFADAEHPDRLLPRRGPAGADEWLLYDRGRFQRAGEDEDDSSDEQAGETRVKQMRGRPVLKGSFDPATCTFVEDAACFPMKAIMAPARNRCLVCDATSGARSVLTQVSLGTSAAVRVVAESVVEALALTHRHEPPSATSGHDGKERLLIFADSRQDAAHQARFITYAGRYDRMRRRLVEILRVQGPLGVEAAVRELLVRGVQAGDNPHTAEFSNPDFLNPGVQKRAAAWEEAPLLDDLAVTTGYRATLLNLGLVGVRYARLGEFLAAHGADLGARLGLSVPQLTYVACCALDEIRRRGGLSRPLLQFHPGNPNCPEEYRSAPDWERRLRAPAGYPCDEQGEPLLRLPEEEVPDGVKLYNAWRTERSGGRGPSLERRFRWLLERMNAGPPDPQGLLELLLLLTSKQGPRFLTPVLLHGYRKARKLLQVNADTVELQLVPPAERFHCTVCNVTLPWVVRGAPCPACPGRLEPWSDLEMQRSRHVQRILTTDLPELVAGEHTAQVTGDARLELEDRFKAPPPSFGTPPGWHGTTLRSPVNVLACSPTLEMGIDVGGLDAVLMRNVPPRPDNYAQRGGRAGRRSRVGVVLSYARSTPHDGYFFDKPVEMIAGEVPAPAVSLGNRDVILRHLHAIAFGAAEPGLAGRMGEYLSLKGELRSDQVERLIEAVTAQADHAVELALKAWGPDVLAPAELGSAAALRADLERLPDRIRELFRRVQHQLDELQKTIEHWTEQGQGDRAALSAMDLKRKLLGLRSERDRAAVEADDRTSGHPMRRFAEFGLLPGYEFPSEPATLRLLHDPSEHEPVSVERRFGISEYQPEALVHARGHRWRVIGLDLASPWNPKTDAPSWIYVICCNCKLRFGAQDHPDHCPRCGTSQGATKELAGFEFGGFVARRDDTPVLEEEDRFATSALVKCSPQWNGRGAARYRLPTGWLAQLRREEEIRWVNEGKPPTESERKRGVPTMHSSARGNYLCPSCGRQLNPPEQEPASSKKGRRKANQGTGPDPFGHAPNCTKRGAPPVPCAIICQHPATTFRFLVPLPAEFPDDEYATWGQSLGHALRTGMRQLYLLDGPEVEFVLEDAWEVNDEHGHRRVAALTFLDPAVGGSGFLDSAAKELHLVAARALEHLDHPNCESSCYRCLRSYRNQRVHDLLSWPRIIEDLQQLAAAPPEPLPLTANDRDDPAPWLEAYAAGVGSPLELKFLRLFEQHGVALEQQVPVAPEDGQPSISIADFRVRGTKVLVYVDGAAFHRGERLRRDRFIRRRLREGGIGWIVVELTASDLGNPEQTLQRVLHQP